MALVTTSLSAQTGGSDDAVIANKADSLLKLLTLEEKASLCSGLDMWKTKPIERLNIPSIWMTDGPHGLRKSTTSDGFGQEFVPATSFPTESSLAASWDRQLIEEMGKAIGTECQANNVQIILGPGVNMKRSPLCGRNFEYYSEDPVLAGELAAAFINGVQSEGVGTSLKHFACNNQETGRMIVSSEVDERTLREIYLRAFEIAVIQAHPWTVMASYNLVNGVYSCENPYLLDDILRKDWGFKGLVVSDWGAVNNRVEGMKARMDLEMPYSGDFSQTQIIEAVKQGTISEAELDQVVGDLLRLILKANSLKKTNVTYDKDKHHQLARKIASQCIVLLKNEGKILPLNKNALKKVAIIGTFAKVPRFNGGGSASLTPTFVDIPYDEMVKLGGKNFQFYYAPGYPDTDSVDDKMITDAVNLAKLSDVAIIFAGLPASYESEGFDRTKLDLPPSHNKLIDAVAGVQKNIIVVLNNGSPVLMPWLSMVKGVVEGGLDGQASGGAIADVLFGVVNPSGKLAETYPMRLQDNPSYLNFPGEDNKVRYGEGIFIGYRYYETKDIKPLFPFGYGLSYTTFAYTGMTVSAKEINDTDKLVVKVKIKNTGTVAGAEVVELYIHDEVCSMPRPLKELKSFDKVFLQPGEEKEVTFTLNNRDFAYYDPAVTDWVVETGDFDLLVGASSADIRLHQTVHVNSVYTHFARLTKYSSISEWLNNPKAKELVMPLAQQMVKSITGGNQTPEDVYNMMMQMVGEMPIIKMINFSRGLFTEQMLDDLIKRVNE